MDEQQLDDKTSELLLECAKVVTVYVNQTEDLPCRFLCEQWDAIMRNLTDFRTAQVPVVFKTLGYLALTMQRVGLQGFEAFQDAAAHMIKAYELIMSADVPFSAEIDKALHEASQNPVRH